MDEAIKKTSQASQTWPLTPIEEFTFKVAFNRYYNAINEFKDEVEIGGRARCQLLEKLKTYQSIALLDKYDFRIYDTYFEDYERIHASIINHIKKMENIVKLQHYSTGCIMIMEKMNLTLSMCNYRYKKLGTKIDWQIAKLMEKRRGIPVVPF